MSRRESKERSARDQGAVIPDSNMVDADSVMKSICNEIQSENYSPVGYDQDTAPRP
ncbi:hypothetical protein PCASD_22895 [Puccinia coronata f. sp. avenae]|uniref:Uncharacterized protein n=1 Tax=Puccinia coronata f. sp. avenae TaxID=200324 RepID=A0A2N5TPF5_9BASI|nr:hypothetical protein PCASD_24936 [Puccinia coronata f. sp. avenae]PLW27379.1 hypothetical protein PCASD_22895 [Puccinia coronata f. sp. avenae]